MRLTILRMRETGVSDKPGPSSLGENCSPGPSIRRLGQPGLLSPRPNILRREPPPHLKDVPVGRQRPLRLLSVGMVNGPLHAFIAKPFAKMYFRLRHRVILSKSTPRPILLWVSPIHERFTAEGTATMSQPRGMWGFR